MRTKSKYNFRSNKIRISSRKDEKSLRDLGQVYDELLEVSSMKEIANYSLSSRSFIPSILAKEFDSHLYPLPKEILQPSLSIKITKEDNSLDKELNSLTKKLSDCYSKNISKLRDLDTVRIKYLQKFQKEKKEDQKVIDQYIEMMDSKKILNLKHRKKLVKGSVKQDKRIRKVEKIDFQNFKKLEIQDKIILENKIDEDIVKKLKEDQCCLICYNKESVEENMIIFCDFCKGAFHMICYGLDKIPNSKRWYCDLCSKFGERGQNLKCALCPFSGGSMKQCSFTDKFYKKYKTLPAYEVKEDSVRKGDTISDTQYFEQSNFTLQNEEHKSNGFDIYSQQFTNQSISFQVPKVQWAHIMCLFAAYYSENYKYLTSESRYCKICKRRGGVKIKCLVDQCDSFMHTECIRKLGISRSEIKYSENNISKISKYLSTKFTDYKVSEESFLMDYNYLNYSVRCPSHCLDLFQHTIKDHQQFYCEISSMAIEEMKKLKQKKSQLNFIGEEQKNNEDVVMTDSTLSIETQETGRSLRTPKKMKDPFEITRINKTSDQIDEENQMTFILKKNIANKKLKNLKVDVKMIKNKEKSPKKDKKFHKVGNKYPRQNQKRPKYHRIERFSFKDFDILLNLGNIRMIEKNLQRIFIKLWSQLDDDRKNIITVIQDSEEDECFTILFDTEENDINLSKIDVNESGRIEVIKVMAQTLQIEENYLNQIIR